MKKIIPFFIFYFLFFVSLASAAGLVPCGGEGEPFCTWCHLMQLIKNIIDFMIKIILPIAAIMIVYGGVIMMIAGGSPEKFNRGKSIVWSAIIGIVIALLAWLVLDTIFKVLTRNRIGPWNELRC